MAVFNTSAIVGVRGIRGHRILMLREWLEATNPLHRALVRWHSRHSRVVVCNSRGVLAQWRALRGGGRTFVVSNWLDEEWFESPQSARESGLILCVGRFNGWKGQEFLADAWLRAFGGSSDAPRLAFLGAEDHEVEYRERAARLASRGAAHAWEVATFTTATRQWYDRASLVVVPSLHPEPFGMVILEALARGCRVIAFPGGGPADIGQDVPQDSLRIVQRDIDALALALRHWASAGGSAQPDESYSETRDVLRARYSASAASLAWADVLTEMQRAAGPRSGGFRPRGLEALNGNAGEPR